jgi:hypothetical protein
MPSNFKNSIVLKDEGGEIVAKFLLVPKWHLLAAHISIGSILLKPCTCAFDTFWWPILL